MEGRAEWPMDILILAEACVRGTVRIDQPVQTEVSVVLKFSVVASVPIHCLAVGSSSLPDGVITPFPDEPAAQFRILFGQVPIFLEITRAVPHGMAVFHQQKRLLRIAVHVVRDFTECGIHSSKEVNV